MLIAIANLGRFQTGIGCFELIDSDFLCPCSPQELPLSHFLSWYPKDTLESSVLLFSYLCNIVSGFILSNTIMLVVEYRIVIISDFIIIAAEVGILYATIVANC